MLAFGVELGGVIFEQNAGETLHGAERGAEIVGNGVSKLLQLAGQGLQLRGALPQVARQKVPFILECAKCVLRHKSFREAKL